jgi:hypothetical protein
MIVPLICQWSSLFNTDLQLWNVVWYSFSCCKLFVIWKLVSILRPRPPRRLCWSCSARAASTTHSMRSRYSHFSCAKCTIGPSTSDLFSHSFHSCLTEVQAFWDWWRQEGQGNISFLDCSPIWMLKLWCLLLFVKPLVKFQCY